MAAEDTGEDEAWSEEQWADLMYFALHDLHLSLDEFWNGITLSGLLALHAAAVRAHDPDAREKAEKKARTRVVKPDDFASQIAALNAIRIT